jgi:hypothetical protein
MRGLVACCLLLLAQPVAAQGLKLVVQTAGVGAFDAAGWTPDGRWLIEASGYERVVRIWDPRADIIVDAIRLPMPGKRADEKILTDRVVVSADGRRARVEAVLTAENEAIGDILYAALDYDVDLVARTARIVPNSRSVDQPSEGMPTDNSGLSDLDAGRSILPASPDGTRLRRIEGGVELLDAAGAVTGELSFGEPVVTNWASVSPDGSMMVFLSPQPQEEGEEPTLTKPGAQAEVPYTGPVTTLVIFNTSSGKGGQTAQPWENFGDYGRVGWVGDGRMLLSEESSAYARIAQHYPDAKGEPAAGWLVDLAGNRAPVEISPGCYLQPLGPDRLVSAGLSSCRHGVKPDNRIWVRPLEGDWTELPVKLPKGATVDGLRAAPDGRTIAISFGRNDKASEVRIVDSVSGQTAYALPMKGPMVTAMNFRADGQSLVVMGSRWAANWRLGADATDVLPATDSDPSMIVSDGADLLFGGSMSPGVQRLRLGDAAVPPSLDALAPVAGGFLKGKPILWVGTYNGELKLFDRRDWSLIATLQRFRNADGEYFIVHDPAGRYDSNLPPDFAPFRWLVADAPFQSLAPQTFMRELYTPDLLARLLDCVPSNSCAAALPRAPDIAALNRTLPVVSALSVSAGSVPGTVDVKVVVKEGVNSLPSGAYFRAQSGMHNLRLFRDGVLVAEAGAADPGLDPADKAAWREASRLAPNQPDGTHVAVFPGIRLESGPPAGPVQFSAYAFNEDRVRGEQAETVIEPPALVQLAKLQPTPRPRRLFLLSIGVDAYPGGLFRPLRYAVADARAMEAMFRGAFINPKEDRPLELVELRIEGTAEQPATRAEIAQGFAKLREATPDDMVVISFSGHGYTDAKGRFSLVPSDVRSDGDRPLPESLIGADDLARWLMPVDAGAIHLVIDACHSAASVQSGGFKPGPMGDPGLGQLAYDKGIRILSASAPDQFAMEDTALGHGLLTYALVVEGARQRKADDDGDRIVTFDELMAYAVKRLPLMGDPTDPSEGPGLVVEWGGPPLPRQTPRLFDFASDWSPLAVRSGTQP